VLHKSYVLVIGLDYLGMLLSHRLTLLRNTDMCGQLVKTDCPFGCHRSSIRSGKPSHRIFVHMHKALNIDKKIKLIIQFRRNGRDESFKPS
jgi:hypothetical protein